MAAGVRKPYTQDRLGVRLGVSVGVFSLLLAGNFDIEVVVQRIPGPVNSQAQGGAHDLMQG